MQRHIIALWTVSIKVDNVPSSHSSDVPFDSDGVAIFDAVPSEGLLDVGAKTKCSESLRIFTKLRRVLVGSLACGGGEGNGTG